MKYPERLPQVRFRPMNESDVAQVYRIEQRCFTHPWSPDLFREESQFSRFSCFRVLETDNCVIGYVGYWRTQKEAHIVSLAVDPDYRCQGWGSLMLRRILPQIKRQGLTLVTLEVRATNRAAQRLYERFGFTRVAFRRGYYKDTGEDAIVYWKRLSPGGNSTSSRP